MDRNEFLREQTMTYDELCDYLQVKYGIPEKPYYLDDTYTNKPYISRTKEGLMVHHRMEDRADNLSQPAFAAKYPFAYQEPKNLVYCNYLEHFLIHIKNETTPGLPFYIEKGMPQRPGFLFLNMDLNAIYTDDGSDMPWQSNCYKVVAENYEDYIDLLARVIATALQTDPSLNAVEVIRSCCNCRRGDFALPSRKIAVSLCQKLGLQYGGLNMLTIEEAKNIGIRACTDAIGYDFCMQHKDNAVSAYGIKDNYMQCYLGVDDSPENLPDLDTIDHLTLSEHPSRHFKYFAICNVDLETGNAVIISCSKP